MSSQRIAESVGAAPWVTTQTDDDPDRGPLVEVSLPPTLDCVQPGGGSRSCRCRANQQVVRLWWGLPWQLGTAAYWVHAAKTGPLIDYTLAGTLLDEMVACQLGGFGIPAAVGLAAWQRVRKSGVLHETDCAIEQRLLDMLTAPLEVNGRLVRYRFAHQRAARIASAVAAFRLEEPPTDPLPLRRWLCQLPGVGPKTASWVVRNYLHSDDVAVVDVHVLRAGVTAGLFHSSWHPSRDYHLLELTFLAWASFGGVPAARLDAHIWAQMSSSRAIAREIVGTDSRPVWACGP